MSSTSRTARWRLAALLSSLAALGLGLSTVYQTRARAELHSPDLSFVPLGAQPKPGTATISATSEVEPPQPEQRAPALLAALARASEPRERTELVTALGETADETALDPLIELVARTDDNDVVSAALLAVARIGGARAREFLERRFSAAKELELSQIAGALASLGGSDAREILLRAAHSTRSGARDAALSALATVDTPDVRALMLTELSGAQPGAAAAYFGDCVEPSALSALEKIARSAEAELRTQAVTALVAQGPSAERSLTALMHGDAETADAVLEVAQGVLELRPVLRAASIERLRAGAITSGPVFTYLAQDLSQEALAALVAAAHDGGSAGSAINALVSRGGPASLSALNLLSRDRDPEVAGLALCAQFSEPDSRARQVLLAASADGTRVAAAAALASIAAPEAAAALDALRRSEQPGERREAALLLGEFGSPGSETELGKLAGDPESLVAAASITALAQLGATRTLRSLAAREDLPSSTREYAAGLVERYVSPLLRR